MGIFSRLRQKRQAAKSGGNFGFIAQNVATIFYAVKLHPFGESLTDDQRLYATGLIDTIAYLVEGSITEKDIKDAVLWGKVGQVGLGFYNVRHREMFDYEDNAELIGLTMQLEALIFENSNTGIDYHEIVNSIVERKALISDMVNKTLEEGTKSQLFPQVMQNTSMVLSQKDFQESVLAFKKS